MSIPQHGAAAISAGLIHLRNRSGDSAVISLFGGQLLSWQTADGHEHLYCSPRALRQTGAPIRGGVPVCFPQFSGRGKLPKHGLVRTLAWQVEHLANESASEELPDVAGAHLSLSDSDATRALWPQHFLLQLQIELGEDWISIALNITNTGRDAFLFTTALHTYLSTPDVHLAGVKNLQGVSYIDTARDNAQATQTEALLRIAQETDRIYLNPPPALLLQQDEQNAVRLEQQGFSDTVIWNPGADKAAQLPDMPPADWQRMLCIEAAQIAQPVSLSPQATWRGVQRLSRSR
jgi:glucose-6-phosphate 1-epimerase